MGLLIFRVLLQPQGLKQLNKALLNKYFAITMKFRLLGYLSMYCSSLLSLSDPYCCKADYFQYRLIMSHSGLLKKPKASLVVIKFFGSGHPDSP